MYDSKHWSSGPGYCIAQLVLAEVNPYIMKMSAELCCFIYTVVCALLVYSIGSQTSGHVPFLSFNTIQLIYIS